MNRFLTQKKTPIKCLCCLLYAINKMRIYKKMEQARGIEPPSDAWQAPILTVVLRLRP